MDKPYDPLPDLIEYFIWSRRSMRMRASHAHRQLMAGLEITADMDPEDATRIVWEAIKQAYRCADINRVKSSG
jgi:hypothetical protein